ncbi:MAG TPA: PIN domain-containing protein [Xanthobacteraceae bacterium]|nr:PIN domain-containing protein [Xanthobacteraceae bacterium]
MKVALDTNILVYAEGVNGQARRDAALDLIGTLRRDLVVVPVQVLGEVFNVLCRKAGRSKPQARDAMQSWRDTFHTIETSAEVMQFAADLASDHHFGIWDAVILSAASKAGCRLLLSEDMQNGFTWGGVTIVDPFVHPRHKLLDAMAGRTP